MKSKNTLLLGLFLFFLPTILSCETLMNCVEGEGELTRQTIELPAFGKISVKGSLNVFILQGEQQRVEVEGQANIINLINREVEDEKWDIKLTNCAKKYKEVTLWITVTEISEIALLGSADIIGDGVIKTKKLEASILGSGDLKLELDASAIDCSIAGSGNLELSGESKSMDASILGSGDIQAENLMVKDCKVDIKGSGNANVNVSGELDARVLGSGDITYKGNPKNISSKLKGSGKLKSM